MAPRIFIFSIVLGAENLSYVKSIETHIRAFLTLDILTIGTVKYIIYLGESVLSGSSTPATTPSSPNGSRNNSPRGVGRGRGRPRGSRGRGGAPRGSPKQQNGTPRPPRLNAKQCLTPPKIVNAVTNGEDSVEPGT